MSSLPPLILRLREQKLFGRLAFSFLLFSSIGLGAALGLLFVYESELPEIRALEDYRPNVVTELYAGDGQLIGSFALQRRILVSYDQIPQVLKDAILVTEDQHFFQHWGVDFPRVLEAAIQNVLKQRKAEGASTLTMQLARVLFLTPEKSFRRKIQETLLALQIERHYTKQQIFTMYCNQIYLGHGNYGFEAASEFYFGKPLGRLTPAEAALLAAIVRGPSYSPILHPKRAQDRRDFVVERMAEAGKITKEQANEARQQPLGLHLSYPRNDLAPYFVEEIRQYLERTYGTQAVHEQGLRVYTGLDVAMQRSANRAVRDGLHAYDRRHGWRGNLPNILRDNLGRLDTYESDDWRDQIFAGNYVTGLVTAVGRQTAMVKIGPYHAILTGADVAWTAHRYPAEILKPGDLAELLIKDLSGNTAHVELEQVPAVQGALVAIDNATGEIQAMVGGYDFEASKFNRATQAMRQVGSSFKIYLYAAAIEQGFSPFDTILDAPFSTISGGKVYAPHNYDERYEGVITLRRALAGSRNVPAVRLAEKVGIHNVVEAARRFGIASPLPEYLPLVLGAADLTLLEHTSAFTVFPDEGVRIEPHMIRKVTTYDGALLEEARPKVYDAIQPPVAHTMTAMLEDVVNFGTAVRARELGRPCAGKTGTTNDYTDAWFIGFTPQTTAGAWVGYDDKRISLGKKETGARAALPLWIEFMKAATAGKPVESFENVEPLEKLALTRQVQVDTPDTAPAETEEPPEKPPAKPAAPTPTQPTAPHTTAAPAPQAGTP